MTSTVATERAFPVYARGENRDDCLALFRSGLRKIPNPDTGTTFTEEEISAATDELSKYYAEADALDIVLLSSQRRALHLADQWRIDRSTSPVLEQIHAPMWEPDGKLPANGGSGNVTVPALVGTGFVGSTTLPDASAAQLRDPATGKRFQVLFDTTAVGTAGEVVSVTLTLKGIDTGTDTNITIGTELEWVKNQPLNVTENATVSTDFRGGVLEETDAEFADRMLATIRHKQAAGNAAQFRAWARRASSSVEDAFVYPCAFHAGSVLVCATLKRGNVTGPDGRILDAGTQTTLTEELTPPGSPVVPRPPYVLVVAAVKQPIDATIEADMAFNSAAGWTDPSPWPTKGTGATLDTPADNKAAFISALSDQQNFTITRGVGSDDLPSGVTAPSLMAWDPTAARFEDLDVASVTAAGGDTFTVVLTTAPTMTLATGIIISPDNGKRLALAEAYEAYFDSLGPGEVVDLSTDERAHRAFRSPRPNEEYPQRAGSGVGTYLRDSLGAAIADELPVFYGSQTPAVPAYPEAGPALMVTGELGIYPV